MASPGADDTNARSGLTQEHACALRDLLAQSAPEEAYQAWHRRQCRRAVSYYGFEMTSDCMTMRQYMQLSHESSPSKPQRCETSTALPFSLSLL